jgi:SOS response regulatory protein OraA/RecX
VRELSGKLRLQKALAAHLLRWPKTARQAGKWLEKNGAGEQEVEEILADLTLAGFLDDRLYARLFVEGHSLWGVDRLRHELKRRGITGKVAESAIEEAANPDAAAELVREWRKQGVDDRKIAARLARRGFPSREAWKAMNSSCPGAE